MCFEGNFMKLRLLVLLFSMCVFSSSVAKEEKLEGSIPFIITEPNLEYKYNNVAPQVSNKSSAEAAVDVDLNQIRDLIRDAKKACCSAIPHGHFKIWIKMDASAKLLGIGTSGESGIEASFDCK
jgi:hypothetical protein